MSDVWDRAGEVIARRLGAIAAIALLLVWLPGVVRDVVRAGLAGDAPATGVAGGVAGGVAAGAAGLVALAAAVLAVLGHLSIVALAVEPTLTAGAALRAGRRRFWPYLGVMIPAAIAGLLLFAPILVAIGTAHVGFAAMRTAAAAAPAVSPGTAAFIGLWGLVAMIVLIWAEARVLLVIVPVVVAERLGLASYRRAFALTRGLTWRIVGVLLLAAVVAIVALLAVQGVVGVALVLLAGPAHRAAAVVATGAVAALAGYAVWIAFLVFGARLYVAARDARDGAYAGL